MKERENVCVCVCVCVLKYDAHHYSCRWHVDKYWHNWYCIVGDSESIQNNPPCSLQINAFKNCSLVKVYRLTKGRYHWGQQVR